MSNPLSLNQQLVALDDYPFTRLSRLLAAKPLANTEPLLLSVGEPQHQPPPMLADTLARNAHLWGKYPPQIGTPEYRAAVAGWLGRRYGLAAGLVDPDRALLPVAGTREALFQVALLAVTRSDGSRPLVLLLNPSYAVYEGASALAGAELRMLPATPATGFLPDLEAIPADDLQRTALLYLCTPSNPEGAVADAAYLRRAIELSREHGFLLAVDECYAEIWDKAPPPGVLQVAASMPAEAGLDPFRNIIAFHSLSKRSSAAGLRAGFVVGDTAAIQLFLRLRNFAAGGVPLPVLAAATALWNDDEHARENRDAYRAKFDLAEQHLAGQFGFYRPAGGFFLWLNVGDGERAASALWREAAIRTLPGAYLTRPQADGSNHGRAFLRVALVHEPAILDQALGRVAEVLRSQA